MNLKIKGSDTLFKAALKMDGLATVSMWTTPYRDPLQHRGIAQQSKRLAEHASHITLSRPGPGPLGPFTITKKSAYPGVSIPCSQKEANAHWARTAWAIDLRVSPNNQPLTAKATCRSAGPLGWFISQRLFECNASKMSHKGRRRESLSTPLCTRWNSFSIQSHTQSRFA